MESDHGVVFVDIRMQRVPSYEVRSYSYLHVTEPGLEQFGVWLAGVDWAPLLLEENPSIHVEMLHNLFDQGLRAAFVYKFRKKKTAELPWMMDRIRDLICKRRDCLLYTSPSPRDRQKSRMPSSA